MEVWFEWNSYYGFDFWGSWLVSSLFLGLFTQHHMVSILDYFYLGCIIYEIENKTSKSYLLYSNLLELFKAFGKCHSWLTETPLWFISIIALFLDDI